MKYIIDTDALTIIPAEAHEDNAITIADAMEAELGAKEWDDDVLEIQKWFYGHYVKDAWCATGLSYFSAAAGKEYYTGKYENVDHMKEHMNSLGYLDCTANYGGGHYQPKRGDVVFMSSKHTYEDCTHVGVVSSVDNNSGEVTVVSCNCDDSIKKRSYNYKTDKYIVAWGRVD